MRVLKVVGMVATGLYATGIVTIGMRKTNAYCRAVPAAFACVPELIMRYVENHGPYGPSENIFRNRNKS